MLLPSIKSKITNIDERIGHCPNKVKFHDSELTDEISISKIENVLSNWFGENVILMASGRSGLDLYLEIKGFNRYKNKFRIPQYCSRCVISSITPHALPVEVAQHGDGMLFYHQYGFPQFTRPEGKNIIEDLAHSFFASETSGDREYIGEVAIFSLPKFFSISGMAGGLVVRNSKIAKIIRKKLEENHQIPSKKIREWMRIVNFNAVQPGSSEIDKMLLDSAYELLLKIYNPDKLDLVGFPSSIAKIQEIGKLRKERVEFFMSKIGWNAFPRGFWEKKEKFLPFAIPYFSKSLHNNLPKINQALADIDVDAGIYNLDINRDFSNSNYQKCVLLPCHQNVSMDKFAEIISVLKMIDR